METDWRNLYGESWKGLITDEAFAHPAKFSRALIRKIYTHLIEDGFLKPGDTVLDPFGGVALGGHDAMRLGLHWVGCELEAKFHALGNGNIDLWRERYTWFPGTATLLNGDSRNLAQVVGAGINGTVSSPPYAETVMGAKDYIERMERLCNEPFESLAPRWQREITKYKREKRMTSSGHQFINADYGSTPRSTRWHERRRLLRRRHQPALRSGPH